MDLIWEGLRKALELLLTLDPEVLRITLLSLEVSGLATLISLVIGLGVAIPVALTEFPGKRLVIALLNTGMGLPPVVVGLFVTVLLWRSGPFGYITMGGMFTVLKVREALEQTKAHGIRFKPPKWWWVFPSLLTMPTINRWATRCGHL